MKFLIFNFFLLNRNSFQISTASNRMFCSSLTSIKYSNSIFPRGKCVRSVFVRRLICQYQICLPNLQTHETKFCSTFTTRFLFLLPFFFFLPKITLCLRACVCVCVILDVCKFILKLIFIAVWFNEMAAYRSRNNHRERVYVCITNSNRELSAVDDVFIH